MKKIVSVISILVTLVLLLGACTPATPAPTQAAPQQATKAPTSITIGFADKELTGGQSAIMGGLVTGANALGWQVITSNANSDASTQANQIDSFIALGVKAIVAVPVDSKAICTSVQAAHNAGIPFFTIDVGTSGCKADMTVQSDNYLGGKQAGEAMVSLLKAKYGTEKGTVLELQGDLSQLPAVLRGSGFDDVMKQYPNIQVISKPTNWDASKFSSITLDVAAVTQLDGIYMHSDCVGYQPVIAALQQLGKLTKVGDPNHIILTGVDGCHDALNGIRDGYAEEFSSQPLPDDGAVLVTYIQQVLNGQKIQAGTVTKEGALWSPATITDTDAGFVCNLATTAVIKDNVDNPGLWGNR
jgi:ABC-type sugar transport system substrate-binding protein